MNQPIIKSIAIRDASFGKDVTIIEPVNLYECIVGDNCFIGPFVEIQKGVIIGNSCKVQSHAFICEMVKIGNNCFISHGVKFINDTFANGKPSGGNNKSLWRATNIGNNVCIGTNATILPVNIVDNVVIGAGSVVTKDINKSGIYVGNPARFLRPI